MNEFTISKLETEMRCQLVEDMAAQLRLGEPFHSAKGCIKFDEPQSWVVFPKITISQIDFSFSNDLQVDKSNKTISLIMWIARKPEEDDFYALTWNVSFTWKEVFKEAWQSLLYRKEADDE